MVRPASEAMCVTAEEKERISLASHNCQKITSYNFRIYTSEIAPLERVAQVLTEHPNCSDRELGKRSGLAPATAKKYRSIIEQERRNAM